MKTLGEIKGEKRFAIRCCTVTCFLLGGLMCCINAQEVSFTAQPQNTTVTRGSDVTISCGHMISGARPVTWIINGTSFSQDQIFLSPLYQQNRQTTPTENSLTVFSINGTTTFQCIVHSTPTSTTSTLGTINVTGSNDNSNNDSSGSSAGAIAGGVIGGIFVAVIIIIIIMACYFVNRRNRESTYDDTANLRSPPGTGGTHASKGDNTAQNDKVVYAAPAQAVAVPHQTAASGEQYAMSTKTANNTSEGQPPSSQYDYVVNNTKKDTQGITYANLQKLPNDSIRNLISQDSDVAYSQVA